MVAVNWVCLAFILILSLQECPAQRILRTGRGFAPIDQVKTDDPPTSPSSPSDNPTLKNPPSAHDRLGLGGRWPRNAGIEFGQGGVRLLGGRGISFSKGWGEGNIGVGRTSVGGGSGGGGGWGVGGGVGLVPSFGGTYAPGTPSYGGGGGGGSGIGGSPVQGGPYIQGTPVGGGGGGGGGGVVIGVTPGYGTAYLPDTPAYGGGGGGGGVRGTPGYVGPYVPGTPTYGSGGGGGGGGGGGVVGIGGGGGGRGWGGFGVGPNYGRPYLPFMPWGIDRGSGGGWYGNGGGICLPMPKLDSPPFSNPFHCLPLSCFTGNHEACRKHGFGIRFNTPVFDTTSYGSNDQESNEKNSPENETNSPTSDFIGEDAMAPESSQADPLFTH